MAPLVGFTTVETKVAEPFVALGKLVALIAEVAWSPDLIGAAVVSPSPATKPTSADAYARLQEDSPWKTGPWLHELSVRARDILADVDASRRTELAVQWGRIAEFRHIPEENKGFLAHLVAELSDLAKQARELLDNSMSGPTGGTWSQLLAAMPQHGQSAAAFFSTFAGPSRHGAAGRSGTRRNHGVSLE